jgi:hypothetical protein
VIAHEDGKDFAAKPWWRLLCLLRGTKSEAYKKEFRRAAGCMRECQGIAEYQMGCLARQMSGGGFDASVGGRCPCESQGGCAERLH